MSASKTVPKIPAPKKIETAAEELQRKGVSIEIDAGKLNIISKVRNFDNDIKSFESRMKTLREQIQEEIENAPEWEKIEKFTEELGVLRAALLRRLKSNQTYVDLMSELNDESLSLKDAKANMSDFLLGYFAETHEKQIELGPSYAREVILKGRLGKTKDFQTNIFSAAAQKEES